MISLLEECWQASQKPPPPPPSTHLDPHTPTSTIAPDISSPALLLRIHTRISQVIKSNVDQSVYSRILRYEPIVVEDLVEWLAEREIEVPELVVRGWCDKEAVCCVGRENLRGGRRARY
jgi:Slx4 endonuclease